MVSQKVAMGAQQQAKLLTERPASANNKSVKDFFIRIVFIGKTGGRGERVWGD